jgi:outer membrane protein assembly factor BamB
MLAIATSTSSWEQFQKDEVNSGKTTDLAPLNVTKAWKVFTHTDDWGMSGVDVAPIVADGKVFVIDARGYAWAFDAKSGEEIWNQSLSCEGWQFQLATPAYGEGKVFFATNDGHVYALYSEDGSEIWNNSIAATYDQLNTPATYADGKVYVGSYKSDNGVNETGIYYCLDVSTGDVLWSRPSGTEKGYYWAGACVIGDYLVYGDRASALTCVYRDNGTLAELINITTEEDIPFNKSDAGGIRSSVAYSEGCVYFTSEGGYAWKIGFNESTGRFTEEGWAFEVEAGDSASTPVVYNGNVYAGAGSFSTDGNLYCLNASDGEEEWNFEPNGGVKASPAISIRGENSYIYFTTNCANSRVYCVDEDGNEMWNFTTEEAGTSGGYILQGVTISGGYVYFGNDGGYVYGLKETPVLWEGEVTVTENATVNVTAHNSGESYEINQTTALGSLDAAAEAGGFNYTISDEWYASYGSFMVDSIAGVESTGMDNWLYWVNYPNDTMPLVGVNLYELEEGDVVTFYYGGWTVTPDNASRVIKIHVHVPTIFDTGSGTYPSIPGTHNGTITPNRDILVNRIYTYPCTGTGGHTEFAMIWNETTGDCVVANWNGYVGDYYNISFNMTLTLRKGVVYNYTIRTGSYPLIIHETPFNATGGTITCDKFIDANGRVYYDWIPAIRLW